MQSVWMIVAALLFSLMGLAVKLASAQYGIWEIVAYRGLVGVAVMGAIMTWRARRHGTSLARDLATRHLGMHLRRSVSGTTSLALWFVAIAGLPLATSMTISSSSPLFIGAWVAWESWRARERIDRTMTVALVAGFVGVLVLLQPTVARDQTGYALIGIASTVFTAIAYLSVKALGAVGEPNLRIVFYFSVANALAGLVGSLFFGFHAHDLRGIALLASVGFAGALAQLAVTRAFGAGGTLLTANLGYSGIIFSTALGYLVYGDTIRLFNGLGITIIVGSSAVATLMTARAQRRSPSPLPPDASGAARSQPDPAAGATTPP